MQTEKNENINQMNLLLHVKTYILKPFKMPVTIFSAQLSLFQTSV
jgi:hypothetical protein